MTYTYPNITNITDFMLYPNIVTGNLFWTGIVGATFLVSLVLLMKFGVGRALNSSLFITGIFAIILMMFGLINESVLIMIIFAFAGSMFWSYYKG